MIIIEAQDEQVLVIDGGEIHPETSAFLNT
jgi:hypothetical protein